MLGDVFAHLFHVIVFLAATIAFVYAIYYRLKVSSKGQKVEKFAPLEMRLRSFLYNVILQKKLFKHPFRGMAHAFIFYGFIVYGFHTLSQIIVGNGWSFFIAAGIDPYTFWLPAYTYMGFQLTEGLALAIIAGLIALIAVTFTIYNSLGLDKAQQKKGAQWGFLVLLLAQVTVIFLVTIGSGKQVYEGVVQTFSLLVLFSVVFFAYRRWGHRAKGLDIPSTQSAVILALIGILMLSSVAGSAAQFFLDGLTGGSWVNKAVLPALMLFGMESTVEAEAVRNFSWWTHIMAIYTFMVIVPLSKHSHLIFAPINFFMIKDQPRGAMNFLDIETSEVYGAANITELPWTSMLDGLSCIECGRCTVQCPANRTGKPLDPKKIMTDIKHAMMDYSSDIMAHKEEGPAPSQVVGDPYITEEEIWGCTSCYACVEACPVGNNQLEAILEIRRNLVLVESRFPTELQGAFTNMENNSNPWGVGAHTRADWCEDLGVKTLADDSNVDLLYWVGCAGAFDDRNKKIARSFVKVLQNADVNFAILGTEENCTGDSARRGGNEYLYQMLAQTNIETMNNYGVKKIVTACPHCYNTLKNEYPQMGGNYEVTHHSDFINELMAEGKIEMDENAVEAMKERRSTYHDSCYLGRYNDIYEQPRNLIKESLGMDIHEAADHHKTSLCCGAGGAQMWMEEKYEAVNKKRSGQLVDTGADTIATACPFCITMITDGVKAQGLTDDVAIMDVAELVATNMKNGTGDKIPGGFARKSETAH